VSISYADTLWLAKVARKYPAGHGEGWAWRCPEGVAEVVSSTTGRFIPACRPYACPAAALACRRRGPSCDPSIEELQAAMAEIAELLGLTVHQYCRVLHHYPSSIAQGLAMPETRENLVALAWMLDRSASPTERSFKEGHVPQE
jgi:hypothetical protein